MLYAFEVEYFDAENGDKDYNLVRECGFLQASSLVTAATRIEKTYGDSIRDVVLHPLLFADGMLVFQEESEYQMVAEHFEQEFNRQA